MLQQLDQSLVGYSHMLRQKTCPDNTGHVFTQQCHAVYLMLALILSLCVHSPSGDVWLVNVAIFSEPTVRQVVQCDVQQGAGG